jgi:hypothetical protein
MTAHDHREPQRVRRQPVSRTRPHRGSFHAFRPPFDSAQSAIDEAIETAYRVCDEYMSRGRSAAHARSSVDGNTTMNNQQYNWRDPMQLWSNAFNAWMSAVFSMMQGNWMGSGMGQGYGGFPFYGAPGPGQAPDGYQAGFGRPPWSPAPPEPDDWLEDNQDPVHEPAVTTMTEPGRKVDVVLEVARGRSARAALSLDPNLSSAKLTLGAITTINRVELPVADGSFSAEQGAIRIALVIGAEQPGGNYSGLIFDTATERACGRIDVQVTAISEP